MMSGSGESWNKISVLVVDDNPFFLEMATSELRGLDPEMEIHVAVDGKEAVDLHICGATFDLVLMDTDMPVMNGTQATKELREIGVKSKIIGMSGRRSEDDRQTFMDAGADEWYVKPLTADDIKSIVLRLQSPED